MEALAKISNSAAQQPLYGSTRVGERKPGLLLRGLGTGSVYNPGAAASYTRVLGLKVYELTDHLGNVRALVTDQKTSDLDPATGIPLLSSLQPVLSNYYNYYAFGMLQPERYGLANATAAGGYRYGFNGQEKSDEIASSVTSAEYWMYDARLGRRWNIDPLFSLSLFRVSSSRRA